MNTSTPNDEERRTMTETTTQSNLHDAEAIRRDWATNARWSGIARDYEPEDVVKLRGSLIEEHTLARHGAERLWDLINTEDYRSEERRVGKECRTRGAPARQEGKRMSELREGRGESRAE